MTEPRRETGRVVAQLERFGEGAREADPGRFAAGRVPGGEGGEVGRGAGARRLQGGERVEGESASATRNGATAGCRAGSSAGSGV